jgi:hypothetical protein
MVAARTMLAVSRGRLVALSTPWGKRGSFHAEWTGAGPWERYEVPATQCPRITRDFLEEKRRSLGRHFYASEYECTFTDVVDQLFTYDDIERTLDPSVRPLFGGPDG